MKSCIEWRKSFKYLPEIDEFNIDFKNNKEEQLLKFLEKYAQSQRVNIKLPYNYKESDIELLIALYKKGYNIVIVLPDNSFWKELKKEKIPFYFKHYIYTWDEFYSYCDAGVSDIFISGELGFELEAISAIAKEKGIQIRCYANIAQSSGWKNENDKGFKNFFIRPEDVDFYSNYVDVIEFYDSIEQQNVLYEIYFKTKEWNGNLREIIKGITLDINNYYILGSEFARRRSQCAKKCIKGRKCQLCDRLVELAESLENSEEFEVFKRRY